MSEAAAEDGERDERSSRVMRSHAAIRTECTRSAEVTSKKKPACIVKDMTNNHKSSILRFSLAPGIKFAT